MGRPGALYLRQVQLLTTKILGAQEPRQNRNQLETIPMVFTRQMDVYKRQNRHYMFVSRIHPFHIFNSKSEFGKGLSNNFVIFSAHSSPKWDRNSQRNSQYCRIIHNSPYSRAPIQSNIIIKIIVVKISESWNRDIHRTLQEENCSSKYLQFSALSRVK